MRAYAVSCLEPLSDEDLVMYMLQLVQVLKFEAFHDSALARFLLRRALVNPSIVGHAFFWYLTAEIHDKDIRDRNMLLLELFLRHCGRKHRVGLGHQMYVMSRLFDVSVAVKECKKKGDRLIVARRELSKIVFPDRFRLPIRPSFVAKGVIVDKCRVMNSKKLPLMLTFEPADPVPGEPVEPRNKKPFIVMYKNGDDLRQDQLTLQVFRVMDTIWKAAKLDLSMSAYECVSTGDMLGMLEIVTNSETIASIVGEEVKQMPKGLGRTMEALRSVWAPHMLSRWLKREVASSTKKRLKEERSAEMDVRSDGRSRLSRADSRFAMPADAGRGDSARARAMAAVVLEDGDDDRSGIMRAASGSGSGSSSGHGQDGGQAAAHLSPMELQRE